MTFSHWMLPAAAVWVATRDTTAADRIADRRDRFAALEALSGFDSLKQRWSDQDADKVWKAALSELKTALQAGVLQAHSIVGGRLAPIASAAWLLPLYMSTPEGIVVGAVWECPPGLPRHKGRAVGGVSPLLGRVEVMAAFPLLGGTSQSQPVQGEQPRRGRPKRNYTGEIEQAVKLLRTGRAKEDVQSHLIGRMQKEGVPYATAYDRVHDRIMPDALAAVDKDP